MIVPFDRLDELLTIYDEEFARRGLDAAVWGHISDGNLHPNVIPRSFADVESGKEAILAFGREVIRLGGSPLAEHGVGRIRSSSSCWRNSTDARASTRCARSSGRSIRSGSSRRECCSRGSPEGLRYEYRSQEVHARSRPIARSAAL